MQTSVFNSVLLLTLFIVTFLVPKSILSQDLVSGQFSDEILFEDDFTSVNFDTCPDLNLRLHPNIFPYPTGMELFLTVNNISGASDSVMVYRYPDLTNVVIYAPYSIAIEDSFSSVDFFWLGQGSHTISYSINAIGTPTSAGESVFCDYSQTTSFPQDGCSYFFHGIAGGTGPLDTTRTCSVSTLNGIVGASTESVLIFPNPSNGNLSLVNINIEQVETIELIGFNGQLGGVLPLESNIDISSFQAGIYIIKIILEDGKTIEEKLVVE